MGFLRVQPARGRPSACCVQPLPGETTSKTPFSARKIAEKLGGEELFPDRPLSSWGTAATDGNTPSTKLT
uniref:Uncharacterized protein n=1 Tax=Anguilla anguilla TaxID=7936 RepID=A0A0E9UF60_ANGAN